MRNTIFGSFFIVLAFFTSSIFAEDIDMRNSYLVVWTINTSDKELFRNALADQSSSMLKLWQSGTIENVYLKNKVSNDELIMGSTGKVVFFIKAKAEADAKNIIDEMPFVKTKVATYDLYPVGILWLKQF